jgi:hypothetical protein
MFWNLKRACTKCLCLKSSFAIWSVICCIFLLLKIDGVVKSVLGAVCRAMKASGEGVGAGVANMVGVAGVAVVIVDVVVVATVADDEGVSVAAGVDAFEFVAVVAGEV